jgi:transposase
VEAWYASRVIVTGGAIADCTQTKALAEGIGAGNPIADKDHDSDAIMEMAKEVGKEVGMEPATSPRCNRRGWRWHNECLCRLMHLVANAFAEMKRWRGIATRYAKNSTSRLATVHIRCIIMWARIY